MLKKILEYACDELRRDNANSKEFIEQTHKCGAIFGDLYKELNEAQQKKLVKLDIEYVKNASQCSDDRYKEGLEQGFKLAIQLIFDSIRD